MTEKINKKFKIKQKPTLLILSGKRHSGKGTLIIELTKLIHQFEVKKIACIS